MCDMFDCFDEIGSNKVFLHLDSDKSRAGLNDLRPSFDILIPRHLLCVVPFLVVAATEPLLAKSTDKYDL